MDVEKGWLEVQEERYGVALELLGMNYFDGHEGAKECCGFADRLLSSSRGLPY